MKVLREARWVRKKINAAIDELSSAIKQSEDAVVSLRRRMQIVQVPFQNLENTPEAQELESHMQKIYVFQVTIGSLNKLLELIEGYKEEDKIEVDAGDDRAWLMSTTKEDAI